MTIEEIHKDGSVAVNMDGRIAWTSIDEIRFAAAAKSEVSATYIVLLSEVERRLAKKERAEKIKALQASLYPGYLMSREESNLLGLKHRTELVLVTEIPGPGLPVFHITTHGESDSKFAGTGTQRIIDDITIAGKSEHYVLISDLTAYEGDESTRELRGPMSRKDASALVNDLMMNSCDRTWLR